MDPLQRDVLKKLKAEKANPVEEMPQQEQPFDLRTAGPLELQQMIGNRATQSLLGADAQAKTSGSTFIQTKLEVTAADDQYEAEADNVAQSVVSGDAQRQAEEEEVMPQRLQRQEEEEEVMPQRLQRQPLEEEEEMMQPKRLQRQEEEEEVMPKRIQRVDEEVDMNGAFSVGGDVEQQIRDTSGGGQAMGDDTRSFFESNMGYDFGNVNIHHDSQSDALNRSLQARAFTHGSDIYFSQGAYEPGSSDGKELLAHELTHVVQQGGAQAQAKRDDE